MRTPELTLLFDGNCPFCAAEMRRLQRWDVAGKLAFTDISLPAFDPLPLTLEMAAMDRELHSITAHGEVLTGIDSMLAAYTLVSKGWLVWPLRVRWLRPLLASLYGKFARNRYRFSRWLGYKPQSECGQESCRAINPFFKR